MKTTGESLKMKLTLSRRGLRIAAALAASAGMLLVAACSSTEEKPKDAAAATDSVKQPAKKKEEKKSFSSMVDSLDDKLNYSKNRHSDADMYHFQNDSFKVFNSERRSDKLLKNNDSLDPYWYNK